MINRTRKILPQPPSSRSVLSIADAAGLLGVGESTVRDMCRLGKIPFTRLGKRILMRRVDLDQLLDPDHKAAAG